MPVEDALNELSTVPLDEGIPTMDWAAPIGAEDAEPRLPTLGASTPGRGSACGDRAGWRHGMKIGDATDIAWATRRSCLVVVVARQTLWQGCYVGPSEESESWVDRRRFRWRRRPGSC
jgi:hypothetical protein